MTLEVDGFKAIRLKNRSDRPTFHHLFLQEYKNRSQSDKPIGRTLLILNIPPYVQEPDLSYAFKDVGIVERVIFSSTLQSNDPESSGSEVPNKYFNYTKPIGTFKVAYVVFKLSKSIQQALQLKELLLYEDGQCILDTGIEKWTRDFIASRTIESELQSEVDEYMKVFDEKEIETKQDEIRAKREEQASGWTTVKRGRKGFEQKESILKKIEDKLEKSKKKKELVNFYTFQMRESKQRHVVRLRKKFDEDKKRIAVMKKARQLKPF